MSDFLYNFDNGKWWRVKQRNLSLKMVEILTKLLAKDPEVRGDTDFLLNQHEWLRETPDISVPKSIYRPEYIRYIQCY